MAGEETSIECILCHHLAVSAGVCQANEFDIESYVQEGSLDHQELADILNLLSNSIVGSKVQFEASTKKLKKDLKANLSYGRVVTAFRELITNKGIYFRQHHISFYPRTDGKTYAVHQQLHTN